MTIINGDCLNWLEEPGSVKAIFADPPDNLGLAYEDDPTGDKRTATEYRYFLDLLISRSMRKCQIFWLSYHHSHDLTVSRILEYQLHYHPWNWRKIIWRFTFGQYTDAKLASGYRPILMAWSPAAKLYFDRIRVISERMRMGDSRASGLRVPDDVWEIPRVVGNSSERRSWHPTQHPEELIERAMLLSCSYSETWVDLFLGTGTSLRVAKRLGIPAIGIERSHEYCERIRQE